MTVYHAERLHASEVPGLDAVWINHEEWCETPDELREPLSRDEALELIEYDRRPGDTYRIRETEEL